MKKSKAKCTNLLEKFGYTRYNTSSDEKLTTRKVQEKK